VTDPNTKFARSFVAGLEAAGVIYASVSPGSRNTPLSIAIADSGITETSHHDERSASFFAIGIAKQTGTPVAIVTTSGTAAAELHPAVAEADAAAVPIIALTADRPTELIGRSAPQTIDQRHLFGPMVRWFVDTDVDDAAAQSASELGRRAVSEALGTSPGPVHCNLRFREPLVIGGAAALAAPHALRRPAIAPPPETMATASKSLRSRRGIIVVGPQTWREGASGIAALGREWGWPVMADPLSGLRSGLTNTTGVVGSDLLAAAGLLDETPPEAVLRFGRPPTSKALNTWMTTHPEIPQIVVAPWGNPDPGGSAALVIQGDADLVAESLRGEAGDADRAWSARWQSAHAAAQTLAATTISDAPFPSEPAVAATLEAAMPDHSTLWAGSSMPIRDVDSFFPVSARAIAIHGHRGANGIDGLVSAAAGAASTGVPTVALTGDVAMLHDIGALATVHRHSIPLTIVVVNNDGGGIFHFLPQEGHRHFDKHFATPHGMSLASIAEGFGVEATKPTSDAALRAAIGHRSDRPRLIEVVTNRESNVAIHRAIATALRSELRST
jgi:2-succinyl-5-enolpyruvyl-6-hydroxy-3-cyclohexene-1-carboxylate synthase